MLILTRPRPSTSMMLSYLAYESKRAYVFQDYQWQLEHYPWKNVVPPGAPPRTPLPALIGGPTVGAPWPEHIKAPRSIHVSHWEVVCPPEKRRVIFTHHIKKQFDLHWTPNATFIFDTWNKILLEETALCVEVKAPPAEVEDFGQVFDLWLWGGPRILDIWERYRDSVVSQAWTTSPLIQRAVDRNTHLFHNPASELTAAGEREDPFNRMVAVHVRRGDYEPACIHFSNWNSTFYGWNQLPWLPDRFEHPAGGTPGNNTEENRKIFLEHCWPDMDQIIRKAEAARDDWEKEVYGEPTHSMFDLGLGADDSCAGDNRGRDHYINTLYVLTNAKSPWINEFKKKVAQAGGWKLVTSKDIVFVNAQEKDVGMAIDMDFARQAAIFIGNGVRSSFILSPRKDSDALILSSSKVELLQQQRPTQTTGRQEDRHQQSVLLR